MYLYFVLYWLSSEIAVIFSVLCAYISFIIPISYLRKPKVEMESVIIAMKDSLGFSNQLKHDKRSVFIEKKTILWQVCQQVMVEMPFPKVVLSQHA